MIRINLLKNSSEKLSARNRNSGKIFFIIGIVAVIGICVWGGVFGYRWYSTHRKTAPSKSQPLVKQEQAPSTYSKTAMVEEVVKEVNDSRLKLRESGILDLPYDQLSFTEKINYELLFTKNVCEMLERIVPNGIGLKSLEMDNFQTVNAVGFGPTKSVIQKLLVALKKEKVTIVAKPYSFIKPGGKEGFKFTFSCKTNFGLNLIDPLVDGSLARLPSRAALPDVLVQFEKLAAQNHIVITKNIAFVSTEKKDNYYRSLYQWSGASSYQDFVKFVLALYDARLMGAFKHCSLIARSSSTIAVESQFVVTTKE